MRGRAWKGGTTITIASLSYAPDHFFVKIKLTYWEKLGIRIRQAIDFCKHVNDRLFAALFAVIEDHIKNLIIMWPRACSIIMDNYFQKIHEFISVHLLT